MQVLSVASEIFPLIKTGGLADVVGALPAALARENVAVRTLVPGYPAVLEKIERTEEINVQAELFGGRARLLSATASGLDLFVLDAPHLYRRPGNPYTDQHGKDWPDNGQRFAALAKAAAELGRGTAADFQPDVVHAHDWQAGLVPAYLHYAGGARPGTVMTVHNLAFQGNFPAELYRVLGLPSSALSIEGIEYYGGVGFLKAGLQFADRITTVSPTYALEISTPGGGMGLEGLLRKRSAVLSGILNGIDDAVWDPASDPYLVSNFTVDEIAARAGNKRALQDRFGLEARSDALLLGVISRLSWQKGLDLLLAVLPRLLERDTQLTVLGAGDAELEHGFLAAAAQAPGRVGASFGYDEPLAHLIQGGVDALLVPSRFEPCGLTQLCAMRYGAIPIVARVGGLNDTIIDANEMALAAGVATGFQFAPVTREALEAAFGRMITAWHDPRGWRRIQTNGMRTDVSWAGPAFRYADLFRELAANRVGRRSVS
jgi:starch synthase